MQVMRRAAVLGFVLAAWACSSNDDAASASALWCGAVCSAARRCDGATDVSWCNSSCQRERPTLANISVEGAGPLAACLEVMNCADLFDDARWKVAYEACWDRAKLAVPLTPSVRTFCETYTLAEFDCRYWYATDACERDFGMWSENVRGRVATCAVNPTCSEADACISAVFEE